MLAEAKMGENSIDECRILQQLSQRLSYEEMGNLLNLNRGLCWKVAHGQKSPMIRKRLGELRELFKVMEGM